MRERERERVRERVRGREVKLYYLLSVTKAIQPLQYYFIVVCVKYYAS